MRAHIAHILRRLANRLEPQQDTTLYFDFSTPEYSGTFTPTIENWTNT